MISIDMMSKADMVKGHGVLSAHDEQIQLLKADTSAHFTIYENEGKFCDITHFHTINPHYLMQNASVKRQGGVTVASVHFLPETVDNSLQLPSFCRQVFYRYLIYFYKQMDYLVVVNPYFVDSLENYGIPREKVHYIPNVVSNESFYPASREKKAQYRKAFSLDPNAFTVLCVGQLQKRKGFFDFLEMARQMPETAFVWAGNFAFKNMSEGYKEIKEAMDVAPPNLHFTGLVPRNRMGELYNAADVMCLPSFEELFPMSILEGMSCGRPILVRDLEEYKKILAGHYLSASSVDDFLKEITRLKEDPTYYKKAEEMSKQGSLRYSPEMVAKEWVSFYQRIHSSAPTLRMKQKEKKPTELLSGQSNFKA